VGVEVGGDGVRQAGSTLAERRHTRRGAPPVSVRGGWADGRSNRTGPALVADFQASHDDPFQMCETRPICATNSPLTATSAALHGFVTGPLTVPNRSGIRNPWWAPQSF